MIDIPKFHDGLLTGVRILKGENIDLYIEDVDGRKFIVKLISVRYMTIHEFLQGNIIFDLEVSERLEDHRKEIADLVFCPGHVGDEKVTLYIAEALEQKCKLVTINPSYGASLIALCGDIDVIEDSSADIDETEADRAG